MQLSKKSISKIETSGIEIPDEHLFELPEKVIQFGAGVLLRGLPDYFIDKANKHNLFNGRIVVVKSTVQGPSDEFEKQDGLYTLCVRGIENGKTVQENLINASISRVLSAKNNWEEILKCAANPDLQVVISNTTEMGLVLTSDDVHASPPSSFPGKLLAFLYQRHKIFKGDHSKGMVIIPTELIPQNADKLLSILLELSHQNHLEPGFADWLQQANYFCNSLVDRIVPGKLNPEEQRIMSEQYGYEDELMIMAEVYRFWAIESSSEKVKEILSFCEADIGAVVSPDITVFRELKLRLLNGSHTFTCGLAHLAGFTTVKEAMRDESFAACIESLMLREIAPAITTHELTIEQATDFSKKVLDRYRNPFIEHQWLAISTQYSSKMKMRNESTIIHYVNRFSSLPPRMVFCFAAYILFMKPELVETGKYYGASEGKKYLINDDLANYLQESWLQDDHQSLVEKLLANQKIWGTDLNSISGFADAVRINLDLLMKHGAKKMIEQTNWDKL